MEMFVIGMIFGGVIGFAMFWNRTRRLEDELIETQNLLDEAVDIIRIQKKAQKKARKQEAETCDY